MGVESWRDEPGIPEIPDDERRTDGAGAAPPPHEAAVPGVEPDAPNPEAVPEEIHLPRLLGLGRGRRLVPKAAAARTHLTATERILILDTWQRSKLPAKDFAALLGLSKHTLYLWKQRFEAEGPGGLEAHRKGARGASSLPELTKRTILMLKQAHPEYGCQRISDLLVRGPGLPASPQAVAKVLHEAGHVLVETPTAPHPDHVRRFERARPNQLWQTDLFTFALKRQNWRVCLVAFLDDHSRFIVSYGLHASQSTALVLEVLRAGLATYGRPAEILTDNGPQYVTWRGTSAFARECQAQGIRQLVSKPQHPQTLGKIERFWGTLWRELLVRAVFRDLGEARVRIGHFIDHYNFQRPHQGLDGLVPADRYFGAAAEVKATLAARVAANARALACEGVPAAPFYLTGQVGDRPVSLHAEGERMILVGADGQRREVALPPPAAPPPPPVPPPVCPDGSPPLGAAATAATTDAPVSSGTSPLDAGLADLAEALPEAGAPDVTPDRVPPADDESPPEDAPPAGAPVPIGGGR